VWPKKLHQSFPETLDVPELKEAVKFKFSSEYIFVRRATHLVCCNEPLNGCFPEGLVQVQEDTVCKLALHQMGVNGVLSLFILFLLCGNCKGNLTNLRRELHLSLAKGNPK
jgi:hypothetical protein